MSHVSRSFAAYYPTGPSLYHHVMNDGASFANLIRTARETKGWSQQDLEEATGVSVSTISRWERGQAGRPEPEHVRAVCAALSVDPRRAAVSLGYLTAEEAGFTTPTGPPIDPEIEDVLQLLPRIPADRRAEWIHHLRYLVERQEQRSQGKNAS